MVRPRYCGGEELQERVVHRDDAALFAPVLPALRFMQPVVEEGHQDGRRAAHDKHVPPAVLAADEIIGHGGDHEADVVAGVHQTHAPGAASFGPLLRDQRRADGPFSTDAHASHESHERERPHVIAKGRQQREEGEPQDGKHQRASAAESVGDRPPDQRHAPADHEEREQQSAVVAHVGGSGGNAGSRQHVAQRGHQNQGKDERIHPIHGPSSPGGPEGALLAGCQRDTGRGSFDDWLVDERHWQGLNISSMISES